MPLHSPRLVVAGLMAGLCLVVVPGLPAHALPPANDMFADARVLDPAGDAVSGTTEDATDEPGEPDHDPASPGWGALHSVWYSWTPAASGVVPISTCGSTFATVVAVYTGSSLATLSGPPGARESKPNGPCPGTAWGGLDLQVTAGTKYWIAVDTWGGVDAEGHYEQTDQTTGRFELQVGDAPSSITEPAVEVKVPDFRPFCGTPKTSLTKCPDPVFQGIGRVLTWMKEARAQGGDVTLLPVARTSDQEDGAVKKYLRSNKAQGSEVLDQKLKPGRYFTTVDEPVVLKVYFFDSFADKALQQAALDALEQAGEDNKNVKSKCGYIDTDADRQKIIKELNAMLGKPGYLTQRDAGALLAKQGCGYEVSEYFDAPGLTQDAVYGVTGVDTKRHLVRLRVGLPVNQDFLLVIREDPYWATPTMLALGTDGKLTASSRQLSRISIQVVERITGRLVSGAKLTFIGPDGRPETVSTNTRGEWTFTSKLEHAGRYAIKAEVRGANGAVMTGFRSIDVVDRGTSSFVTMSGRTMTHTNGDWVGTQEDVDRAKSLPMVPANLGTGLSGAPTAPPVIVQATAAHPNGDGTWTSGQVNSVRILDDTNFAVVATDGFVDIGGGLTGQVGSSRSARAWPNPFQAIADAANYVATGLARAIEQGAGTIANVTTAVQRQGIARTAEIMAANGAATPSSNLISDKGLGIISDNGGGVISTGGLNVISTGGLNLRDAQGNLIGQAGGNLIGQAGGNIISNDGAGVISTGGLNLTPVRGGNLIGQAGGN